MPQVRQLPSCVSIVWQQLLPRCAVANVGHVFGPRGDAALPARGRLDQCLTRAPALSARDDKHAKCGSAATPGPATSRQVEPPGEASVARRSCVLVLLVVARQRRRRTRSPHGSRADASGTARVAASGTRLCGEGDTEERFLTCCQASRRLTVGGFYTQTALPRLRRRPPSRMCDWRTRSLGCGSAPIDESTRCPRCTSSAMARSGRVATGA